MQQESKKIIQKLIEKSKEQKLTREEERLILKATKDDMLRNGVRIVYVRDLEYKPRVTLLLTPCNGAKVMGIAAAVCNPVDNFDKLLGFQSAAERLMSNDFFRVSSAFLQQQGNSMPWLWGLLVSRFGCFPGNEDLLDFHAQEQILSYASHLKNRGLLK